MNDDVTAASVYASRPAVARGSIEPSRTPSSTGVALLALLAVGGWWFGLLVGAYVLEIFDFRLGRAAGVCAAGGGVLVALLNVPLTKQLPKPASAAVALTSGLLFLALAVPLVSPGYYAMRAELRSLDPQGWKLLLDQRGGNSICFDVCTSITRILQPDTPDDNEADRTMTRLLKSHGYRQVERSYSGARVFRKGRLEITSYADDGIAASPGYAGRPPGWTLQIEAAA